MSPWTQFLQQNSSLAHEKNKDFIKQMSHQWKNLKSQLITLHIDYVHALFTEKQNLQIQVQQLKQQLIQLQQQLDYHNYCLLSTNETFEDLA